MRGRQENLSDRGYYRTEGRRVWRLPLIILLLAACAVAPFAQAADAERIVVTNARLIGRDAPAQDVPVNLLIVDGKLVVVTKDDLVIQPGDVAVDASGGFLFGQLVLGSRPSFVILDQDPRENCRCAAGHRDARTLRDSGRGDRQERAAGDTSLVSRSHAETASMEGVHAAADRRPDSLLRQQEMEQV